LREQILDFFDPDGLEHDLHILGGVGCEHRLAILAVSFVGCRVH